MKWFLCIEHKGFKNHSFNENIFNKHKVVRNERVETNPLCAYKLIYLLK